MLFPDTKSQNEHFYLSYLLKSLVELRKGKGMLLLLHHFSLVVTRSIHMNCLALPSVLTVKLLCLVKADLLSDWRRAFHTIASWESEKGRRKYLLRTHLNTQYFSHWTVNSHQENIYFCHICWRTIIFCQSHQSMLMLSCPKCILSYLEGGMRRTLILTSSCLLKKLDHTTLKLRSFNCREFLPQQFRVTLIAKVLWMFSSQFIWTSSICHEAQFIFSSFQHFT